MQYYEEIKQELINNEAYKKVKDYSKNRSDLTTYYNVGKLLSDAGKHYGYSVLKEYSNKLSKELGKKYSERSLRSMRQFYTLFKDENWQPLVSNLTWSHCIILMTLKNKQEINYYINQIKKYNLSKRKLSEKIKSNEYERLPQETREKLITKQNNEIQDFIKNPIVIRNDNHYEEVSEKVLKNLILEDMSNFLKEIGDGFCYIDNEYKIKVGDRYNYIDLLLFNYIYNAFVVVELKVTELSYSHIGQITHYMNYIDKNVKTLNQEKTIGIIICKKDNKFVMEYCSDPRIFSKEYVLN